ncbi:MAG: CDP-alcohol phosphatidyltransferase family protein [bacterium]
MKAIIIAPGKRLESKDTHPKILLKLCGGSLLKRDLCLLRTTGIREVTVLGESHTPEIEKELKNGKKLGMRLDFVRREGWSQALSFFSQDSKSDLFLVIDGDCVFEINLLRILLDHKKVALCCDSQLNENNGRRSPRILSKDGKIQRIGKNLRSWNKIYAGVALCNRKILSLLEDRAVNFTDWVVCLNRVLPQQDVSCLDLSEASSYDSELRQKVKPFWRRINSSQDLKEVKKRLIRGTQKRTLDVMAWYVHRPIENRITYYLSELPLTPNQLTILTSLLAFSITFLFFKGYLLLASGLTFVVNIMDGLDGKQARATGLFTHIGNLEHSLDTLYEQSWYAAFSWAIFTISRSFVPLQLCLAMIIFDTFNRHCSMQFRAVMRVPLADYGPFDRAFRRFDGRRNIYTVYILVGILIGQPMYSLFAMLIHAIITSLVYFLRSAKHMHAADTGR